MSADRDQQSSEMAQPVFLLRGQVTAQISEMGDMALADAQDVDGVVTA